jgi:hypothetical protein
VLQRCIDHASDHQRIQLVNEITYNALTLVQDPYGNYVCFFFFCLFVEQFRKWGVSPNLGRPVHPRLERQQIQ